MLQGGDTKIRIKKREWLVETTHKSSRRKLKRLTHKEERRKGKVECVYV